MITCVQFAAKMIPQTQVSGVNGNDGMLMLYVRDWSFTMYVYGNFTDNNSRKRPLDEGMNVQICTSFFVMCFNWNICVGDEGPQVKKPSIGGGQSINAQAIAQAAIAK